MSKQGDDILFDYPIEKDEAVTEAERKKDLILISFLLLLHMVFRFLAGLFSSEWYAGTVLFLGTLLPFCVFLCFHRGKKHLSHWLRHPVHIESAFSVFPILLFFGIGFGFLQYFLGSVFASVGTVAPPRDNVIAILLFDLLLPALGEELLFRGVILQRLRHYGMRAAVVVSALAFALSHGAWAQIPYALIAGLLLGTVALYTHSVLPAIVLHFALNFVSVELSLIPESEALFPYIFVMVLSLALAFVFRKHTGKAFRKLRKKEKSRSVRQDVLAMLLSSLGVVLVAEFILSFRWF